jgi:hypothetical protein
MAKNYDQRKQQVAEIQRKQSLDGRDIGPLPKVKHPKRRKRCRLNFRDFCETYYPNVFNLEWSNDHLKVIGIIQNAMLNGGLFAVAMPRGSGKTSLATVAAEWALLYGHRRFIVLIGSSETHAQNILKNIATDLDSNDLLLEDFPEVCYPIRQLDGITKRCQGQLLNGERTQIHWTAKELTLPTVCGSVASGATIRVTGITGSFRGMNVQNPADGKKYRPDFVLIDDPQDDESARSPKQVKDRVNIVNGAVLGLAGVGKKIAGVMPITVIAKGDMADTILDRKAYPQWQGVRTKLLNAFPTDTKLWEQYAEVRADGLRQGLGLKPATEFYLANRAALEAGAEAAWPARHNPDEATALQHAMNLKLDSEEAFMAEYQNEPLSLEADTPLLVSPEQVSRKALKIARGIVPQEATKLTAFIDVQGSCLFYCVLAVANDFTAHVVDYGAYPDQKRSYYFLREVSPTIKDVAPGMAFEAQLYEALTKLSARLLARPFAKQEGGEVMRISRLVVDSGWQEDVVTKFCRESALTIPSKGRGITADRKAMTEYTVKPGERQGWNWRVLPAPFHMEYDTNAWKTFVAQRILTNVGEAGNLSLFDATPNQHKLFAEHVTAEYPTPTEGMGRVVNVWKARVGRENHFLDCLVGCYVAASEQGILFVGQQEAKGDRPKGKRRKLEVSF